MKTLYQEKIAPFLYSIGACQFIKGFALDNYSRIWYRPDLSQRGQNISAHKISYLVLVGDIPEGLFVLHRCNHKACVNPSHLYLGTNQQNQLDASKDGLHPVGGTGVRGVSSTFRYGEMKYKAVTSGRPRKVLYYGTSLQDAIEARKNWEHG